jgi:hypothetical protein
MKCVEEAIIIISDDIVKNLSDPLWILPFLSFGYIGRYSPMA